MIGIKNLQLIQHAVSKKDRTRKCKTNIETQQSKTSHNEKKKKKQQQQQKTQTKNKS